MDHEAQSQDDLFAAGEKSLSGGGAPLNYGEDLPPYDDTPLPYDDEPLTTGENDFAHDTESPSQEALHPLSGEQEPPAGQGQAYDPNEQDLLVSEDDGGEGPAFAEAPAPRESPALRPRRALKAASILHAADAWIEAQLQDKTLLMQRLAAAAAVITGAVALAAVCELFVMGIAWRGVGSAVPASIRMQTLAQIEDLLADDDAALVNSAYGDPNSSGIRSFAGNPALLSPWSPLRSVMQSAEAQLQAKEEGVVFTDSDELPAQGLLASRFVAREYEALGQDMGSKQREVIIESIGKALMAAATTLGLMVAYEWLAERRKYALRPVGPIDPGPMPSDEPDFSLQTEQQNGDSLKEGSGSASEGLTLLD